MKRSLATLICTLAWIVAPVAARQPEVVLLQPAPAGATQTVVLDQDANDVREQLRQILEAYPPAVRTIIGLDPALMSNATFMAPYPRLVEFLAQHPDVVRNPSYYFGTQGENFFGDPQRQAWEMWEDILTGSMVFIVVASVAAFLGWLLKTFMDHRRWLHVSRVQTEAHNKLLDRLTGHEDLLAYIQSPSGRRFLEAAPVLEAGPKSTAAPVSRVIWSAQIGLVLIFAGFGLLIASGSIAAVGAPLFLMGVFATSVGVGFVLSSGMAYVLSRRLGLMGTETSA